ncbi:MAG: biotin attachment protein, partial [Flavobacterium psychrophilum]
MLNISKEKNVLIVPGKYASITSVARRPQYKTLNRIIIGFMIFLVACLFLPWTQNIGGSGAVTTLKPDQRPQTVHNTIAGRIEKWFVQEGDYVKKGDTILFISEIKEDYFDPNLLSNTKQQVDAKKMAYDSYGEKVNSLEIQAKSLS